MGWRREKVNEVEGREINGQRDRRRKRESDGGKIRTTEAVLTLLYCVWVDGLMI